jgi:hypothetical protein
MQGPYAGALWEESSLLLVEELLPLLFDDNVDLYLQTDILARLNPAGVAE